MELGSPEDIIALVGATPYSLHNQQEEGRTRITWEAHLLF